MLLWQKEEPAIMLAQWTSNKFILIPREKHLLFQATKEIRALTASLQITIPQMSISLTQTSTLDSWSQSSNISNTFFKIHPQLKNGTLNACMESLQYIRVSFEKEMNLEVIVDDKNFVGSALVEQNNFPLFFFSSFFLYNP